MPKGYFLPGFLAVFAATNLLAGNPMLGEVELEAASKIERNAGVWLDGQFLGAVEDLQGRDKLILVPGKHELLFKLLGYQDVATEIIVEPGEEKKYRLTMRRAHDLSYPEQENTARLRFSVDPEEAAIFIDGFYVGDVDQFDDRRGMRLEAGAHRITIALPGYKSFESELNLLAGQTYEIKTALPKGDLGGQAKVLTVTASADPESQ